jgi:hypothetical protein
MRSTKFIIPAIVVFGGLLINSTASYGTVAMAKKEKKSCVTCHVKNGAKELNDTGKYYHEKKTLEGAPAK